MSDARAWPRLLGRQAECSRLDRLVTAVLAGEGQVVVLRGEPGIGKTALLEYVVEQAGAHRVARVAGVESERQLGYAGLHQLCGPFLDRIEDLPTPQREALGTALGMRSGSAPERFHLGLGVLTLLCLAAEEESLICVIDDLQWLDRASVQTLDFVARRLDAEPVALVVAVRDADEDPLLPGLPDLLLSGLSAGDAEALLESGVPGPLDRRVRDRILGESHGNPLALLEVSRGRAAAGPAFGPGTESSSPAHPASRLEQGFARRLRILPAQSRKLLLAAAAEPLGNVHLLFRAAERLGIGTDALTVAEGAGLIDLGAQVGFRHPLLRTAVYRSATPAERRQVHQVLAEVTDPAVDPDRRAWHRAQAAVGTDEHIAAELEGAAGRAASAGGVAAVGAFLDAAATLTPDPAERARRSLEAGQAKTTAGAFDDAVALLAFAESSSLDEDGRARVDLLRAQVADHSAQRPEAIPLLLAAARRFETLDPRRARDTYLEALSAALFAGRLAPEPATAVRVTEAARAAPVPDRRGTADELLEAMSVLHTDGYAASAPLLSRAVRAIAAARLPLEEAVRSIRAAGVAAVQLWDDSQWDTLTRRQLDVARGAGALSVLPLALAGRAVFAVRCGDLSAASALVAERQWLAQAMDVEHPPASAAAAWLAAVQGRETVAEPLLREAAADATARGHGADLDLAHSARAVLLNGLGRYEEAMAAARVATAGPSELSAASWALAELVEAGVYAGDTAAATRALDVLSVITRAAGTEWGLGVEAASAALLSDDDDAEDLHREAIERLGRTRIRLDLARARLRYGEWLRRQGRRVDARVQLRTAHDAFTSMGADAFADRVRHELVATGETVRRRTEETREALTAQEGHIARLAADGLTNPEIAARLYLSPRTVEWHLRKVFTKVGVSTRRQLRRPPHDVRPR
ncbi:MAG: ATP-binding protein [Blastococcus sp.]